MLSIGSERSGLSVVSVAAVVLAAACGGQAVVESAEDGGTGETGGAGGTGGTAGTGAMGGTAQTGGTAGTGGSPPPCVDCSAPPQPPDGAPVGDGPGTVLAVSKMYFGDTDRNGVPSHKAWMAFGYDLDGKKSSKDSTDHCKVAEGASKAAVQTDGYDGIDNSYGANIVPILVGLDADFSGRVNEIIQEGSFTVIVDIDTLGAGTNYVGLPASLLDGAQAVLPKWDGNDDWTLHCETMIDCKDAGTLQIAEGNKSAIAFPNSYVADGTWVSGDIGSVEIQVPMFFMVDPSLQLTTRLRRAVITMDFDPGAPPTSARNGTIAGVIDTEEFVDKIRQIAGYISPSLCEGPTMQSVLASVRAASDIMVDGSQDPDQVCNGISVGYGFDAKAVKLGAVLDRTPPMEDPCEGSP